VAHSGGVTVITIGTQVRYFFIAAPSTPRVAFVTETRAENSNLPDDDTVALCVLNPGDVTVITQAPYSATPQAGHWSWPPGVTP
jgi:hypothetical protein